MTLREAEIEKLERLKMLNKAESFYDEVNPFRDIFPEFLEELLLAVEKALPLLEDWYYEAKQTVEDLEEEWR